MDQNMTGSLKITDEVTRTRNELNNLRKAIRSLQAQHKKDVSRLELLLTDDKTLTVGGSQKKAQNACTSKSHLFDDWSPIGHISSWFRTKNGTPRQGSVNSLTRGRLKLEKSTFNNPQHALQGLEQYSHVWILFVFDKNTGDGRGHKKAKVSPPRLDGHRVGVFATRTPHRPNPLGLTLAHLDKVEDDCLYLSGLDILDGTPVLDIKPYIFQYDAPPFVVTHLDSLACQARNDGSDQLKKTHHNKPSCPTGRFCQQNPVSVTENENSPSRTENAESFPLSSVTTRTEKETEVLVLENENPSSLSLLDCQCTNSFSYLQKGTKKDHFNLENQQVEGSNCIKSISNSSEDSADDFKEKNCSDNSSFSLSRLKSNIESKADCTSHLSNAHRDPDSSGMHNETNDDNQNVMKLKDLNLNYDKTEECGMSTASWIKSPPLIPLEVCFNPVAESQLNLFSSTAVDKCYRLEYLSDSVELRSAISGVLSEDPRSTYRRQKCPSLLYYFTVDIAHITAWFDGSLAEVLRVKPLHS